MKLKLNNQKLLAAIKKTERFYDKKDISCITSHYLFEADAENSVLKITATDYEFGLTQIIRNVAVETSGRATAPAKKFGDILKKIGKDDEIVLEVEKNDLFLRVGKFNFNLAMFNYDEFPALKLESEYPLNIDSDVFKRKLKLLSHAMDKNNPKLSLNGIHLSVRADKFAFAATETHRLAVSYVEAQNAKTFDINIPAKAVVEIQKLFEGDVKLFVADTLGHNEEGPCVVKEDLLLAKTDEFEFFTKLINDKFPNFERVIPTQINETITLNKSEMRENLKKMAICSNKLAINFRLDGKVIYQSLCFDNDGVRAEFDKALPLRDNFVLGVNADYLNDFLSEVDENQFTLKLNEESTTFIAQSNEFFECIAPILNFLTKEDVEKFGFLHQDKNLLPKEADEQEVQETPSDVA